MLKKTKIKKQKQNMSFKQVSKFFQTKLGKTSIISLAILLIAGLGFSYSLLNKPSNVAKSASVVSLAPGQTGIFTIQYINAGDSDAIANAVTAIALNNRLTYVPGFFTEQFGGPTAPLYCVNDTVGAGIVTLNGDQTTSINYRPRSATSLSTPCNGSSTAGAATLTAAPEASPSDPNTWPVAKTGVLTFRATLRSDQGLVPGNTVNFAIIAETTLDGASGGAASLNISVVAAAATTIANGNIGTGVCTPSSTAVNTTYACNFPLTGNAGNNYQLPANGITASTSQTGNGASDLTPVSGGFSPACTITGNGTANAALNCTAIPTAGGTAGVRNVLAKVESGAPVDRGDVTLLAPAGTVIAAPNVGTGTCTPSSVVIGTNGNCTFPLTGDSGNNYQLPAQGIAGTTSQTGNGASDLTPVSGGYGNPCTITGNGTAQASLVCSVPTTGGTPGARNTLLQYNGAGSPVDEGDITLLDASSVVRSGRLYCIGLDNAPVNFDVVTRENTACNITQKFKDGVMTIVYDDLKDLNGVILTSGTCTFEFLRYPRAYLPGNVLRTYTGTINSSGACTTTLAAVDQTVNYYVVVATAVSGNTVLRESYNLNLNVGG